VTIKPQFALALAPLLLGEFWLAGKNGAPSETAAGLALCLLSLAAPIIAALAWLAAHDALAPFVEMVTQYLPLHLGQTASHRFLPPSERTAYLIGGALWFGGFWPVVPLLVFAGWAARRALSGEDEKSALAATLFALAFLFALSPALAGQYWPYHYKPFIFVATMVLALLALPATRVVAAPRLACASGLAGLCAFAFAVAQLVDPRPFGRHDGLSEIFSRHQALNGGVARATRLIAENLHPGETVQPIDWTEGVIQAMLRLEAPLGTPFLYDYHFHHSVDAPIIERLRARFVAAMRENKPALVMEALRRPRVSGVGTAKDFPQLDRLLSENYHLVHEDELFRLYRLNEAALR